MEATVSAVEIAAADARVATSERSAEVASAWWRRIGAGLWPRSRRGSRATKSPLACAQVFDDLLILEDGRAVRSVVVAPAAPVEAAASVTCGLVSEAERRGMRVLAASLRIEAGILQIESTDASRGEISGVADAAGKPRRLLVQGDLRTQTDDVLGWLAEMAGPYDLVLIEAPALSTSPVGALLAGVCDGLLILAQGGSTAKHEVRDAAAVARSARCHVFGVFVDESGGRLPNWLANL